MYVLKKYVRKYGKKARSEDSHSIVHFFVHKNISRHEMKWPRQTYKRCPENSGKRVPGKEAVSRLRHNSNHLNEQINI